MHSLPSGSSESSVLASNQPPFNTIFVTSNANNTILPNCSHSCYGNANLTLFKGHSSDGGSLSFTDSVSVLGPRGSDEAMHTHRSGYSSLAWSSKHPEHIAVLWEKETKDLLWIGGLQLTLIPLAEFTSIKSDDGQAHPWRDDAETLRMVSAFNDYLNHKPLSEDYAGAVSDAPPVALRWSVGRDMPRGSSQKTFFEIFCRLLKRFLSNRIQERSRVSVWIAGRGCGRTLASSDQRGWRGQQQRRVPVRGAGVLDPGRNLVGDGNARAVCSGPHAGLLQQQYDVHCERRRLPLHEGRCGLQTDRRQRDPADENWRPMGVEHHASAAGGRSPACWRGRHRGQRVAASGGWRADRSRSRPQLVTAAAARCAGLSAAASPSRRPPRADRSRGMDEDGAPSSRKRNSRLDASCRWRSRSFLVSLWRTVCGHEEDEGLPRARSRVQG